MIELKKKLKNCKTLVEEGNFDLAIKICQEVIDENRYYLPAYWNLSYIQLLLGNFNYWFDYSLFLDERYQPKAGWYHKKTNGKVWGGENLNNKIILLYCDEGYGDLIQFSRYIDLIKKQNAYIILQCPEDISELMKTNKNIDKTISFSDEEKYDFYCPLMHCPILFDIKKGFIPNKIPYLYISNKHNPFLEKIFENNDIRIGLAYKGNSKHKNDSNRSIDPSLFKKLGDKGTIYSLQKGEYGDFFNTGMMISNWNDTSFLVSKMDLVISVDTSIAHLSAAMGKKTYLLLPKTPDWRWMLDRNDSPWYPNIKIFRHQDTWENLIEKIYIEI